MENLSMKFKSIATGINPNGNKSTLQSKSIGAFFTRHNLGRYSGEIEGNWLVA
jgi:hypothetical protein